MSVRGGSIAGGPAEPLWIAVDAYYEGLLASPEPALEAGLKAARRAELPSIEVSPLLGRLLEVLARACGARRILEVGTLGGYSTTWLARSLPEDGRLVTLELEERHAKVARANLERAGVAGRVEIRLGRAADSLRSLAAERAEPFDLVFIDADKPGYTAYLELCLPLTRRGTLIVADNVVRQGAVISGGDPAVDGIRSFNERVAAEPRLVATALQTVGSKGYDGLLLAVVV